MGNLPSSLPTRQEFCRQEEKESAECIKRFNYDRYFPLFPSKDLTIQRMQYMPNCREQILRYNYCKKKYGRMADKARKEMLEGNPAESSSWFQLFEYRVSSTESKSGVIMYWLEYKIAFSIISRKQPHHKSMTKDNERAWHFAVGGAVAGVTSRFVIAPFDVIKIR